MQKLPYKLKPNSFSKSLLGLGFSSDCVLGIIFGTGFNPKTTLKSFSTFFDFFKSAPFRFCLLYAVNAPAVPFPYKPSIDDL